MTKCVDSGAGESICNNYLDKTCTDSFTNSINCTLNYAHSTIKGSGSREASFSNVIDCKSKFLYKGGPSFTLKNCCFFRLKSISVIGSPKFINCICDFSRKGITKVSVESTIIFKFKSECGMTRSFTRAIGEISLPLVFIHFVAM